MTKIVIRITEGSLKEVTDFGTELNVFLSKSKFKYLVNEVYLKSEFIHYKLPIKKNKGSWLGYD